KFCKVGSCPTKDTYNTWLGLIAGSDPLTVLQRCNETMINSQVTGLFRYANVPGLSDPIELYFAGPDYEPMKGENYWTQQVSDTEIATWMQTKTLPKNYNSWYTGLTANQQQALKNLVSWREFWSKTKSIVQVSTDKGNYAFTAQPGASTKADFQSPFWHFASVMPDGTINVHNQWSNVAGLGLPTQSIQGSPFAQPDSIDAYKISMTMLRPPGMACWNVWGSACKFGGTSGREPWTNRCIAKNITVPKTNQLDGGIVNLPVDNMITSWQAAWDSYLGKGVVCGKDTDAVKFNQINW
ncbi:MAG: hypothetical protein WCW31_02400, partial [Patescibacteria group bacterium]